MAKKKQATRNANFTNSSNTTTPLAAFASPPNVRRIGDEGGGVHTVVGPVIVGPAGVVGLLFDAAGGVVVLLKCAKFAL